MAHCVGTAADDERTLARSRLLSEDAKEEVLQVKIEARDIIARLDPVHIDSWPQLIWTLEDCVESAKRNMFILCGSLREETLDSASEHNRQIRRELNGLIKKWNSAEPERGNLWPTLAQRFRAVLALLKRCVRKLMF